MLTWVAKLFGWQEVVSGNIPQITQFYIAVDSASFDVSNTHQFEVQMCLKLKMDSVELDGVDNIPIVYCLDDIKVNFNSTIIAQLKIMFTE